MIRLLAVFLILWPLSGRAETVIVRSGDHADFSRLLLEYNGGLDWSFGSVDGGYEFRPDRTDLDWDLRTAFVRISRARIRALEDRGDGRLFISVDCACHADAFVLRNGQVVVDIKDGPAPFSPSPFEARLAPTEPTGSPQPQPQPVSGFGPRIARTSEDRPMPLASGLPDSPRRTAPSATLPLRPVDWFASRASTEGSRKMALGAVQESEQPIPADAGVQAVRDRVSETEAALIEQIARAAAQGMIEADLSRIEDDILAATRPFPSLAPEPVPPQEQIPPAPAATPRGHVVIETGMDRAAPAPMPRQATTDEGAVCTDPAMFDIANWGAAMNSGADIGAYRSKIIGEFDLANGAGVTDLARHYLYITFGAETKALLTQFPVDVVRPDLLKAMAEVIDEGHASAAEVFVDQMACDGATALWAALAQPRLYRGRSINSEAITLSFAGLPSHLRGHLGPGLAEKFVDIGDIGTAERLRNAIARGAEDQDPVLNLLSARLDLAAGETENASAQLDKVLAQGSDVLPKALLDRIEVALENGEAIAAEQISLLQSLAFENRRTELGASMTELELRARALSGDLEGAFARLAEAQGESGFTAERGERSVAEIFGALLRDASDPTILKLAVAHLDQAVTVPAPMRRGIAQRFLRLGLSAPARRVLGGEGAIPDKSDRLLFARAAMVEGRPEVAVGYLAGIDGEAANILRAEAMERAGDFVQAARLFDAMGLDERGGRAAWRGGVWSDVASRSGILATAAGMMDQHPPFAVPSLPGEAADSASAAVPVATAKQPTLETSSALLDESRATRATLDELLQVIAPIVDASGT